MTRISCIIGVASTCAAIAVLVPPSMAYGPNILDEFKLLPDDGAAGDVFGTSVAISGSIAIVGAPFDDDLGPSSGSAYLFDTTTGEQITKLVPDDGGANDSCGFSGAISCCIAIVGAR